MLLGTIDFSLLTVDVVMTVICVALMIKHINEKKQINQRRSNHGSGEAQTPRQQELVGQMLYSRKNPQLLYWLIIVMVIINLSRSSVRSILIFAKEISLFGEDKTGRMWRVLFIARFSFLLLDSIQNFMIFASIVAI